MSRLIQEEKQTEEPNSIELEQAYANEESDFPEGAQFENTDIQNALNADKGKKNVNVESEQPVQEFNKEEDLLKQMLVESKEMKNLFTIAHLKPMYDTKTLCILLHDIRSEFRQESKNYAISMEDIKKGNADELAFIIHRITKSPEMRKSRLLLLLYRQQQSLQKASSLLQLRPRNWKIQQG